MGLHVQGTRSFEAAAAYIRAVRPSMVKWLDGATDPVLVEIARSVGAITVLRVYQEDQNMDRVSAYLARVEQAMTTSPNFDAFEVSYNEAHQAGEDLRRKSVADIRGMALCERHGKKAVIGCFSVGMPDLPDWALYAPALEHAAAHGHYLGLHEYGGGSQGLRAMVEGEGSAARGWAFLRYRRLLDWAKGAGVRMPRILITESGIDVLKQADRPTRGFQTVGGGYDYAADLRWAADRLGEDAEVAGWCDFGWAADDPQWTPFDLSRDSATLARVQALQAAIPEDKPKEVPMPDLNAMLAAEFGGGYADLRASLPKNPSGPNGDFSVRALGHIDTIAVHHTAGPKEQTWPAIASFHITGRQWAGIGYHIGIRRGAVSYLGDVSQARACCLDQNHRVVCVVLTGDYDTEAVDQADREVLARVVAVLQKWAGQVIGRQLAVKGHKEVPGQSTACPGSALLAVVHGLVEIPTKPAATPGSALLAAVDKVHRAQGITLNPTAALQRAIRADGLIPTTRELEVVDGGVTYIAQRAEALAGGGATIFYVAKGDWAHVRKLAAS